ncbi:MULTISPECIES: hypothetical protein [unclassified Nocardia]|uniref:hypothetical protein n=1 Tax=unclassified Nocardia TaxID=2637762 RepID=UPI001CE46A3B|nr:MULTISPECIES: hypothetical protein [unclassified Nocardia]
MHLSGDASQVAVVLAQLESASRLASAHVHHFPTGTVRAYIRLATRRPHNPAADPSVAENL